jgi:hypothetical protein
MRLPRRRAILFGPDCDDTRIVGYTLDVRCFRQAFLIATSVSQVDKILRSDPANRILTAVVLGDRLPDLVPGLDRLTQYFGDDSKNIIVWHRIPLPHAAFELSLRCYSLPIRATMSDLVDACHGRIRPRTVSGETLRDYLGKIRVSRENLENSKLSQNCTVAPQNRTPDLQNCNVNLQTSTEKNCTVGPKSGADNSTVSPHPKMDNTTVSHTRQSGNSRVTRGEAA